ncbi:MAG TPA: FmdB family zinc ribbon protein [Candidatus Dormibacteraeota bacterium]|nr:FmdB family zinc ribbon protein [Candidatus Dormibacteraeota bacterium]
MPTYEYECLKCPRVFEVRQRITEPALETCDRCGGPIHRLLSATPFILKGGGWYVTDYPSEARKKGTSSDSGSESKESAAKESTAKESTAKESKESTSKVASKDGGSAESKPAASSESKSSTDTGTGSASSTAKATKPSPAS